MYLLYLYFIWSSMFYLWPKQKEQAGSPWYKCAAVGKNKHSMYTMSMYLEAGISKKTNQSWGVLEQQLCLMLEFQKILFKMSLGICQMLLTYMCVQQMKQMSNVLVQGDEFNKENLQVNTSQATSVARFAHVPICAIQFFQGSEVVMSPSLHS